MNQPIRISQSELVAKKVLDQYFGNIKHFDNHRPDWLNGMELDRYYPTMGIAIEFQGDQHSRIVPIMQKGPEDFQHQVNLDTKKRHICESRGIKLHSINLLDLDRFRIQNFAKSLAKEGTVFAEKNGYRDEVYKLSRIKFEEPDPSLMRSVDRLSHSKKDYYKEPKSRKSWLQKLFKL